MKYRNETEKDDLKDRILSYKQMNEEEKDRIRQNIIVCLDSNMFKLTNGSKPITNKNTQSQ